jgi:hypothetical protein
VTELDGPLPVESAAESLRVAGVAIVESARVLDWQELAVRDVTRRSWILTRETGAVFRPR